MTADSVVVEGSVLFLYVLCFLFDAFFYHVCAGFYGGGICAFFHMYCVFFI